ncbi:MAG: hypothetical protein LBO66_08260 [Deltaproteobacteria bacterium]|nr:hypothetical protein [Deltaproteobacteria bacterium]
MLRGGLCLWRVIRRRGGCFRKLEKEKRPHKLGEIIAAIELFGAARLEEREELSPKEDFWNENIILNSSIFEKRRV